MERLTRKSTITGKWMAAYGPQKITDHLAAYEDTKLTPEQIQAQQQEIDRLQGAIQEWKDGVCISQKYLTQIGKLEQEITALVADKDEQAGRIMQYDTALRQAREALTVLTTCPYCWGVDSHSDACLYHLTEKAIDDLLGGKEDV